MPPDRDPSSFQVARIAGIPIRLHFTFLLFLVWIGLAGAVIGASSSVILVVALFACVALHELGHALVAAHYGIKTASITLYPIGGIARISERPKPGQELWIALAGPAVNVAIAAIAYAVISAHHAKAPTLGWAIQWSSSIPAVLYQANIVLALFNMMPAFPMDGGRVLRSILALSGMPIARATNTAAQIGQFVALAAGIYAIFQANWLLMFIAFFVYIGAGQEAQMVRQETIFTGVPLSEVMLTNVETLAPGASLREVADRLLHTTQQDFPVLIGEEVVGLMTRDRLFRTLSTAGPDAYVAGNMIREFNRAEPTRELTDVIRETRSAGRTLSQLLPLLILDPSGRLRGMVTAENLAEFFAIRQILGDGSTAASRSTTFGRRM
jgi:Zn-dependent protease